MRALMRAVFQTIPVLGAGGKRSKEQSKGGVFEVGSLRVVVHHVHSRLVKD